MTTTPHVTTAVAHLTDALGALHDARHHEEAPAGVLALASVRVQDIRDALTQWEVQ